MKKLLALLLAMIMVFSMFACTNTEDPKDSESDSQPAESDSQSDSESKETEPQLNHLGTPDRKFDGRVYRIWHANANIGFEIMYADELDGTSLTSALVDRAADVEDTYDVTIDYTRIQAWGEGRKAIENMVASGKSEADLVNEGDGQIIPMTANGVFHNIATLENIDVTSPWYMTQTLEEFTINNNLYLLAGSFTYGAWWDIRCVFMGKDAVKSVGLNPDDIYQLVRDGKWTLDKALELTENRYQDIDGTAGKTNNDFYGWAYNGYQYGWAEAMGLGVVFHNEDGSVSYNFPTQQYTLVANKLIELMDSTRGWNIGKGGARDGFKAGRIMFVHDGFNRAHEWFSAVKFGVLPAPKVTEDQAEYTCGGTTHWYALPITLKDSALDFASFMADAFAAAGYEYLLPAYFEKGLKTKYSASNADAEMFDLIHSTSKISLGFAFSMKTADMMGNCMKPGSANATAEFASYVAQWEAKDKQFVEALNKAYSGTPFTGDLWSSVYN